MGGGLGWLKPIGELQHRLLALWLILWLILLRLQGWRRERVQASRCERSCSLSKCRRRLLCGTWWPGGVSSEPGKSGDA